MRLLVAEREGVRIDRGGRYPNSPVSSDPRATTGAVRKTRRGDAGKRNMAFEGGPDGVITMEDSHCPDCNSGLSGNCTEHVHRQSDYKVVRKNTEYHVCCKYCRMCCRIVSPKRPGILPGTGYGFEAHMMATVMCLMGASPERIRSMLGQFMDVVPTAQTINGMIRRIASAVGPAYQMIRKKVLLSRAAYYDDAGWRVNGMLHWLFSPGSRGPGSTRSAGRAGYPRYGGSAGRSPEPPYPGRSLGGTTWAVITKSATCATCAT